MKSKTMRNIGKVMIIIPIIIAGIVIFQILDWKGILAVGGALSFLIGLIVLRTADDKEYDEKIPWSREK